MLFDFFFKKIKKRFYFKCCFVLTHDRRTCKVTYLIETTQLKTIFFPSATKNTRLVINLLQLLRRGRPVFYILIHGNTCCF